MTLSQSRIQVWVIHVSPSSLLLQGQSGLFLSSILLVAVSFQEVPKGDSVLGHSPTILRPFFPLGKWEEDLVRCCAFSKSGHSSTPLGMCLTYTFSWLSLVFFCRKNLSACVNFPCVCGSHMFYILLLSTVSLQQFVKIFSWILAGVYWDPL